MATPFVAAWGQKISQVWVLKAIFMVGSAIYKPSTWDVYKISETITFLMHRHRVHQDTMKLQEPTGVEGAQDRQPSVQCDPGNGVNWAGTDQQAFLCTSFCHVGSDYSLIGCLFFLCHSNSPKLFSSSLNIATAWRLSNSRRCLSDRAEWPCNGWPPSIREIPCFGCDIKQRLLNTRREIDIMNKKRNVKATN